MGRHRRRIHKSFSVQFSTAADCAIYARSGSVWDEIIVEALALNIARSLNIKSSHARRASTECNPNKGNIHDEVRMLIAYLRRNGLFLLGF